MATANEYLRYRQLTGQDFRKRLKALAAPGQADAATQRALGRENAALLEEARENGGFALPALYSLEELGWLRRRLEEDEKATLLPPALREKLLRALANTPPTGAEVYTPGATPAAPHDAEKQRRAFLFFREAIRAGRAFSYTNALAGGGRVQGKGVPVRLEHQAATGLLYLLFHPPGGEQMVIARLDRLEDYALLPEADAPGEADEPGEAYGETPPCRLELVIQNRHNAVERLCSRLASRPRKMAWLPGQNAFRLLVGYYPFEEGDLLAEILSFGPLVKVEAPAHFAERLCSQARAALEAVQAARDARPAGGAR